MRITRYDEKQQVLGWASRVRGVAERMGDSAAVAQVESAVEQFERGRFVLAVVGMSKSGKSTLCNALLGRRDDQVAPVGCLPATCVVSRYMAGGDDGAEVVFQPTDAGQQEPLRIGYPDIREYALEDRNPGNCRHVKAIEVRGRFAALEGDLVLVETPGAESVHELHDQVLLAELPEADAVVFLSDVHNPVNASELEVLRTVQRHGNIRKVFFAINKVDSAEGEELRDAETQNRKVMAAHGIPVDTFFPISARSAMLGDTQGSGCAELAAAISSFLSRERGSTLRRACVERVMAVVRSLQQSVAIEAQAAGVSEEQIRSEIAALTQQKEELRQDEDVAAERFMASWGRALSEFQAALPDAEETVLARVGSHIGETWAIRTRALVREMPTYLHDQILDAMRQPVEQFQQRTREAVDRLKVEYPAVVLTPRGEFFFRVQDKEHTLGKGLLKGGLLLGLGGTGLGTAGAPVALVSAIGASLAASLATVPGVGSVLAGATGAITGVTTALVGVVVTPLAMMSLFTGGSGIVLVALAYRRAQLNKQQSLEQACTAKVREVFAGIRGTRVQAAEQVAPAIVKEFGVNLAEDLARIESAMRKALQRQAQAGEAGHAEGRLATTRALADLAKEGAGYAT